jgi:hypothetical protein
MVVLNLFWQELGIGSAGQCFEGERLEGTWREGDWPPIQLLPYSGLAILWPDVTHCNLNYLLSSCPHARLCFVSFGDTARDTGLGVAAPASDCFDLAGLWMAQ